MNKRIAARPRPMQTIQIRLTQAQIKKIDNLVKAGKYPNRSEAIRDMVRDIVEKKGLEWPE